MPRLVSGVVAGLLAMGATALTGTALTGTALTGTALTGTALTGTALADPAPVCPPGYQVMPGTNWCTPGAPSQNGQLPPVEPGLS